MDKWFRFYNSARHSRKVNGLSPICFRCWVLLLTIASEKNGIIPKDFDDLSFELRMEPRKVTIAIQTLVGVGLLIDCGDHFKTPDWEDRQFKSDTSKARQQAWRDRQRDVTVTATVTAQESEKEKEKEKKETKIPNGILSKKAAKPRTQIGDYRPGINEQELAQSHWKERGREDLILTEQLGQFFDHHKSHGSLMADWPAAWRTWYRNAPRMNRKPNGHGTKADRPSAHRTFIAAAAELAGYDTGD